MPSGEGTEAHADVETLTLGMVSIVEEVLIRKKIPSGKKNQSPESERDPESVAETHPVDPVHWVDNIEVTVNSYSGEEEDPCRTVGCQQKEQDATHDIAVQPVLSTPVVVGSERQAEQHDGVGNSQVSQVHRVGLPCVHVKDEHPQCDNVPHQPKHELHNQYWWQNLVQDGRFEGAALGWRSEIHL